MENRNGDAKILLCDSTFPGWRSRGYLPHFDVPGAIQSITFRLADSLPKEKLERLESELSAMNFRSPEEAIIERRRRIEAWLDAGMGSCALRHPKMAAIVQDTFLKFDGEKYFLHAWCVMPNHVHALIEPKIPLSKIVQSWKSFTGRWAMAHAEELGLFRNGAARENFPKAFWMREYWDRYIRSEKHFFDVVAYIHENPVKAGLCASPDAWEWSSARHQLRRG